MSSRAMTSRRTRLPELEQRCRELGLSLTIQRRAIFEVLLARDDHPTADEVAADLALRIAGIAKATVYRTLETLVTHGLLIRVCHHGAVARYDIRTDRHHHLVCDRCGAITDFEEPELDALALPDFGRAGFRVRDFSVHVRGLCRKCARSRTQRSKNNEE
jgi:Fur family peroxide stress response transcriptional regulator